MIGAVSFKFDIDTLKESYSLFLKTADEAKKKLNASMGFVVQPFTSAAVRHASETGGNPTGFTPTLQNRKPTRPPNPFPICKELTFFFFFFRSLDIFNRVGGKSR